MLRLIAIRLVVIPLVLLAVSVGVFFLVQVVPGQPGRVVLGPYATQQQVALWQHRQGLDGSVVARYLRWIGGFARGRWGTSLSLGVPVRPLVLGRLGNSILLGLFALLVTTPVAIGIGLWQAHRLGRRSDRVLTLVGVTLSSIPEFVSGVILLILFAVELHWFPVDSQLAWSGLDRVRGMLLPAVAVAVASFGHTSRMMRSTTTEVLGSAHYRTAVLNGVPPGRLLRRHVLRNALIPTTAVLGNQAAFMLGGLVIVEILFNYPGLGQLLVDSVVNKDIFVLEACTLVAALVSMLVILTADVAYRLLDPRVRSSPDGR
ncbi:ABC transporter permease [Pseudofrankia inefficax]|uniref:Binding-protein-dependent transport systems inner membrane component n=1 Tax=Pseudofrankia inefficax (strain DSM 45817 / CECT 9037 / DDB 130130 / EuI1c) TaxID=298654 RepID=E3J3Q8_PSEI1|nr:ABC transporter permease [Pseudofrankia inefficax]ADP79395.1 binding-protein-dependent transport systems inner membrane component [Pseudofrankia inefficax]